MHRYRGHTTHREWETVGKLVHLYTVICNTN